MSTEYTKKDEARIRYIGNNHGGAVYNNVDVLTSGIGEFTRENIIIWLENRNTTKPVRDVHAVLGRYCDSLGE